MIYNDFQGLKLSALGMGCMRLPVKGGAVDEEATFAMVDYALAHGVNYIDTAWGYHDGESETVIGRALARHPREKFYLATKFPGYDPAFWGQAEEIFEKQLEKCRVEYFDFYLFHNVCEMNIDAYLDGEKYGIYDYLIAQKKNGRIRHLGFSAHGSLEVMERFLNAYGKDMEFCQIELNYFDWRFQDAKAKVELLQRWNLPIWVMEPVRGGQLAKLSADAEEKLRAARPDEEVPAWAFRFLQGIPGVTVTLSGMSNMAQMQANIATYAENKPLTAAENALVLGIADDMMKKTTVPCTGCRYCAAHCPQGLDIPHLLHLYNEAMVSGAGDFIAPMALAAVAAEKQPSQCLSCHSCEVVCPQQIRIPEALADFARRMGQ